jgi:hypothetical protein
VEAGGKPKEERKSGAEYQAGDDGEIEGSVFAAMDDVAGEFSQAEREFAAEVEKSTGDDEEPTENEECAAEFADRIHEESVKEKQNNEVRK